MTPLVDLWLAILLSSIAVFLISWAIHAAPLWHKNDYPRMPKEDAVMDALRPLNLPPGEYAVPRPQSMQEMNSPEFTEKMKRGPVVMLNVHPNGPSPMGTSLAQWFVFLLVTALFAGYIASRALPVGADFRAVFRFVGAPAFMAFAFALWQMSIWYRRPWPTTLKETFDGLIYALVMAAVFGWLWPR